jgi:hypothetical protein
VKGTTKVEEIDLLFTHRGVILTPDIIYNADTLFGSAIPEGRNNYSYSLAWGG